MKKELKGVGKMRTKNWLSMLMVLLMAISLVACGSTQKPGTEINDIVQSSSDTESPGVASSGLPITPEKTTISAFIMQMPTGMIDVKTNTFTTEMEEMTNVHLDMVVAPNDGAKEKLNLLLASDDYPEIILGGLFNNAELVKYGTEEKILIPLNDLIDKYAINLKERWSEHPSYKNDMTSLDGNIYGIPAADSGTTGHGAASMKLWMNMDWLEKLGLDMPVTTEDFHSVLKAFKTQDPNGNNKQDEIPLTGAINTWNADPYLFLLNAFDYYDNGTLLKLKDGKVSFCANTDGFKQGLKYIATLYNEGLIDPAAFTQNEQQLSAIGNNEGVAIAGAAAAGHLGMFVGVNNIERCKQYDNIFPLQGPNGYRGTPYAKDVRLSGAQFVITDKCKRPDVAIRWADLFCSEEITVRSQIGIKGKQWDDADPGTVGMDGVTPATRKYLTFETSGEVAKTNDTWGWTMRLIEPNWKATFQVEGDIYDPTNYEARLYRATIKLLPYAADVDQMPSFWMNNDDSSKINQIFTPLNDYVKTSIVEFITGKKDVDKDWDTYISGLSKLNYEEYVRLYQTAYDALVK
ncbi:MAG: extracellular solute-binding protein [Clostridiaceae bacterium]|nr:extracellular solute-binding protein [Clostridiaceae bacterium]